LWLIWVPFALGGFILAVLGATRQRGIWMAVFVVWCIMFLFNALHGLVISFGNLFQFPLYEVLEIIRDIPLSLIAILLFVAFIKDLKQQIPRNVWHYIGIFCALVGVVNSIVVRIFYRFFGA